MQVFKLIDRIYTRPQCYLYLSIALKERFASAHVIDMCFQVSNIIGGLIHTHLIEHFHSLHKILDLLSGIIKS